MDTGSRCGWPFSRRVVEGLAARAINHGAAPETLDGRRWLMERLEGEFLLQCRRPLLER